MRTLIFRSDHIATYQLDAPVWSRYWLPSTVTSSNLAALKLCKTVIFFTSSTLSTVTHRYRARNHGTTIRSVRRKSPLTSAHGGITSLRELAGASSNERMLTHEGGMRQYLKLRSGSEAFAVTTLTQSAHKMSS